MSRYGFYNRLNTSSAISVDSISEKDVEFEVAGPPNDSISSLAFSNAGDFLAAGSWNNEVRFFVVLFYSRDFPCAHKMYLNNITIP